MPDSYTQKPVLLASTGSTEANETLQRLVAALEAAFPHRIRGYYLEGSYADQSALTSSDIDLIILFKHAFTDDAEPSKAEQIIQRVSDTSQLELDVGLLAEAQLTTGAPPALKLGSTRLFGEPVPVELPLVSVAEWGRERMHAAYWLITKVFGRPNVVTLPRAYPQPQAEFFGYTERTIRLADGSEAPSTRDLIRVMGWAATALVARLGKQMVTRKKECHLLYRQHIHDEWAPFLEALYERCRMDWHYRVPTDSADRAELKRICQRALEFENHFLGVYKQFLLSQLRSKDSAAKQHALWVQEQIPLNDDEIMQEIGNRPIHRDKNFEEQTG